MSDQAAPNAEEWSFSADRPIAGRKGDKFQRASFADALVTQVLALPKNDSFVLGLVGPWGSGKTSILGMIEETMIEHEGVAVLKFNPWLFSGTEQLAAHFFQEIAAQLHESSDKKLQEAGDKLMGYSEALSPLSAIPFVGKWAERIAGGVKAAGEVLRRQGGVLPASVTSQRKEITRLLAEQDKRLLVIVDDLDRLPKSDIRELFKLVRLTADFPNTTYLLAFDRPRVESALGETEGEGRAYLEKILQVTFDVPVLREPDLTAFLEAEIMRAVGDRAHGPFDKAEWINVFHLAVRPLFDTPRDVRRYTNAIPVALSVVGDEIAIADLLAIEAIRSLMPDVWAQLHASKDLLTNARDDSFRGASRTDQDKQRFEGLLAMAGGKRAALQQFLSRVFPPCRRFIDNTWFGPDSAKGWRKKRRLVHPILFQFYFEKSLPPEILRGQAVQEIFENLGDEAKLRELLTTHDAKMIEHVCARLEDYENDFPAEVVESALVVFFEQYQRLREGRQGFGDFGAGMAVTRIGLRLLRRVKKQPERDDVVKCVFARMKTLSERRELNDLVGWRPKVGHKLVSRGVWADLEQQLHEAIASAGADALAAERDLLWLLVFTDDGTNAVPSLCGRAAHNDSFFLRLLRSGLSERSSFGMGDVAERREYTLPWEYLVDLCGEGLLLDRINELSARRENLALEGRDELALDVGLRYRGGWRPGRFTRYEEDGVEDDDDDERGDDAGDVSVASGEQAAASPTATPSTTSGRAEARPYRAEILLQLIGSAVSMRRETASARILELARAKTPIPDAVASHLVELVADDETSNADRVLALDMLMHLDMVDRVISPLARLWITSTSIPAEMSPRVASIFRDHPERLPTLIAALQRAPLDSTNAQVGLLAVAHTLEHHAACLQDDVSGSALKAAERFAGIADHEKIVARVRTLLARAKDATNTDPVQAQDDGVRGERDMPSTSGASEVS